MQNNTYRKNLIHSLNGLKEIRETIFENTLNLAMEGDLKDWNDTIESGETFVFDKKLLLTCADTNVQLFSELISKIESTFDTIANINNLSADLKNANK